MVKITTVTYKRLVSVEKFGNVSVEATGQLDDGEDRDAAFDELRRYVDLQVMTRKHAIEGRLGQDDDEPAPRAHPRHGNEARAGAAPW